jgi:predicted O-methyltransferase YrrM
MDTKELISLITANDMTDIGAATRAVQAFEEATLDKFIALQFGGDRHCPIEVNVSNEMQSRLFERIQKQWAKVGDHEPYASVLSHEKFSMKNIAENLVEFRDSGADGIRQLMQLAQKNGVTINFNKCFELGCGVGRMTAHFAEHFEKTVGADISPGNLKVCDEYLKELNISNVDLKLLTRLDDLETISNIDAFVSFIAIQHNPPPIQHYMLEKILPKLNYGGVFLFQTIVHHPTYTYTAESNFNYPANQDFEMHCLPMRDVLQVINKHDLTLLDVIKDRRGGYGVDSNTFFGINLKDS